MSPDYAYQIYASKNNTYGSLKLPYSVHIYQCLDVHTRFRHLLIPKANSSTAYQSYHYALAEAAIHQHDMIEDCGMNYNDIIKLNRQVNTAYGTIFATEVADIVYAVSNELGKNRKERASKTYPKIKGDLFATYVKLCDRIANSKWSKHFDSDNSMFEKYKQEFTEFHNELYMEELHEMFVELLNLYNS